MLHCLEVLVTLRGYFQISLLIIWKYWSLRCTSSKYQAPLFGSMVCLTAILPNNHPSRLGVWSAQQQFFQIITSRVWKYGLPNSNSSKYSPHVFGSMVCLTAILPCGGLCRANEALIISPGRPFNICALLAAAPQKGRKQSGGGLWAYGISDPRLIYKTRSL